MAEPAVRISGLTRRFGEITAVDDLSLEIGRAEIFGLTGSDGAGKTTTLRLICGLLEPDSGEIEVAGVSVRDEPEEARRRLGYLPQAFGLHDDLSVAENIQYFADLFCQDMSEMEDRLEELLAATGLTEFTGRMAGDLSGGMKQKSALICALIHRPQVLLLDEPTRGVDPVSRRDLWRIVYGMPSEEVTVVVATPDADEAERCDRLGVIADGQIVEMGAPQELTERYTARLVEVGVDDQRRAHEVLREMDGVLAVSGIGDRLRVSIAEDGPDAGGLAGALEAEGCGVAEADEIEPRLEDALLVLEEQRTSRDGERAGDE
ncbi:MAG: ABC transporter ATP-binding protein [Armatimonadota bacterium]